MLMPACKYVGPFDEVQLETGQVVKRDEVVTVSADLAERLLEQSDNWHTAPTAKKKGDA